MGVELRFSPSFDRASRRQNRSPSLHGEDMSLICAAWELHVRKRGTREKKMPRDDQKLFHGDGTSQGHGKYA